MVRVLWLTLVSAFLATVPACAQVINAGLKLGANYSWTRSDDSDFRREYNTRGVPGFNIGAAFSFQLKERYFLHTELLFSKKGRIITGDYDLRDEAEYNFIEIPLMYQVHFKGKLGAARQYKWYAGIGPNFSYWLGGVGRITHFEITDHDIPELPYRIRFGERLEEHSGESDYVYITDARRIQVGINLGGGIAVEPSPGRKIMVDLRFELGHSWLGGENGADYIFPDSYSSNFQQRNFGLRLSGIYFLQTNTDKKVRNKGKSSVIKKGRMLERRK